MTQIIQTLDSYAFLNGCNCPGTKSSGPNIRNPNSDLNVLDLIYTDSNFTPLFRIKNKLKMPANQIPICIKYAFSNKSDFCSEC